MSDLETIVAAATPMGESAIAVVRVSGPLASGLVELISGSPPLPRRLRHTDYRDTNGTVIDDVVLGFYARPSSYTGDDVLEISCHGNMLIVSKILDDLRRRGCRLAEPGEFTRRAFQQGKIDLTRAEAVMDVIRARSDRALKAAQQQLRGALQVRVQGMADRLLDICASIEAYIDFPEEDLPREDRDARLEEIRALAGEMKKLGTTRKRMELLREGIGVVLLGEPNVGKSSLFNRMAGFDRSIVSDEPGTTRDFLEERIVVGPHRIRLFDTAGIRESPEGVEAAGVAKSIATAGNADIILLVVDVRTTCPTLSVQVRSLMKEKPSLIVMNKCDLRHDSVGRDSAWEQQALEVSAITGAGVEKLMDQLARLVEEITKADERDEDLAVNLRHAVAFSETVGHLDRASELIRGCAPTELAASELRAAVCTLKSIVGTIDDEQILDRLFARFCIGK